MKVATPEQSRRTWNAVWLVFFLLLIVSGIVWHRDDVEAVYQQIQQFQQ
jgi:hypothetical protein